MPGIIPARAGNTDWFVSGDALYIKADGSVTIPIGTILIWESKAPRGYLLPAEREYHLTWVEMGSAAATFVCKDRILREEVIINKVDKDIKIPVDNTEFTMWMLDPKLTVVNEDGTCAPIEGVDLTDGEVWIFIAKAITGADGKVWILVQTNKTTTGTAANMEFHQPHLNKNAMSNTQRFDPRGWDLFGLGEYSAVERVMLRVADFLGIDEYITRIALIYGAVVPGFTTEGGLPLSYAVVATHELPDETVLVNRATSHITRNWYTDFGGISPMSEGEGVSASSGANGLLDNDNAAVETRVIQTLNFEFMPHYGQWESGWHRTSPGWYKTGVSAQTSPAAGVVPVCVVVLGLVAGVACVCLRKREER